MNTAYLLDRATRILRRVRVITAIAWTGSSVYFVFPLGTLTKPVTPGPAGNGADGELRVAHGGGCNHPQQSLMAPRQTPGSLHGFCWKGYPTWLTGFGRFTALYLFNAATLLRVRWCVAAIIRRTFGQRKNGHRTKRHAQTAFRPAAVPMLMPFNAMRCRLPATSARSSSAGATQARR